MAQFERERNASGELVPTEIPTHGKGSGTFNSDVAGQSRVRGVQPGRAPLEAPDARGFESGPKEPFLARAAARRSAAGQRDQQTVERVENEFTETKPT